MRRYLLALVILALAFALGSFFAVAQSPSAATASPAQAAAYAQPESSLAAIHSDKAVSIVANGISPRELTVDSAGNVYLTTAAASNRIFTLTGLAGLNSTDTALKSANLALLAGNGSAGSLGDGGSAFAAQFDLNTKSLYLRSGLAVAADGTIFVADTLNSTIRRIAGSDSPEPGIVRSIAGRWAAPQTIKLAEPLGTAVDRSGNLYLADRASGAIDLLRNAAASRPGDQSIEILAHVVAPGSLAVTTDGRKLFVASPDTGAVFAIDTQTRQIQPVPDFPAHAVDAQTASGPVCGAAPQSSGPSICPAGLAVDGANNLFVADANSGQILRIDGKTSASTTAASGLRSPGAIAFDRSGNLFVAEQAANRIIKFTSMGATATNLTLTAPAALPAPPAPRVCPQTAPFNFCDQPTGGSTPIQAFTLTNTTSAAVSGLAFSFTGTNPTDFQAAGNTCGTSLSAGASCVINVDFAPSAAGARSASLTVTDSASDSASATVSGTGDDFQLKLSSQEEQSVIQGGTITYNFSIVPDTVFGGDVTIACPSNLPSLTTCTPSANTVTVTPGTPASFSIKFATTYNGVTGGFPGNGSVPILTFPRGRTGPPWPMVLFLSLSALLAALALLLLRRQRTNSAVSLRFAPARLVWGLSFLLVASALAFLGGCKHHSVPSNLNTPPGSTTMLIQGSSQNAGRGVTIILDVTGRG